MHRHCLGFCEFLSSFPAPPPFLGTYTQVMVPLLPQCLSIQVISCSAGEGTTAGLALGTELCCCPRPRAQKGPMLGFMLCCCHFEVFEHEVPCRIPQMRQRSWEDARLFGRTPDSEIQFGGNLLDYACFFLSPFLRFALTVSKL